MSSSSFGSETESETLLNLRYQVPTRLNCLESRCFGSEMREPGTSAGMLSIVFKNASNVCTLNTYFKLVRFVVIHFVPNKSGATINIQTSPTAVIPMTSSASSKQAAKSVPY